MTVYSTTVIQNDKTRKILPLNSADLSQEQKICNNAKKAFCTPGFFANSHHSKIVLFTAPA